MPKVMGSLAIVDYKVAADQDRADRYTDQLRVYALAGRGEGLTVEAAYLHELRDGSRGSVDISPDATDNALATMQTRLRALRRSEFHANPGDDKCGRCEYARVCAHATAIPDDASENH